MDFFGKYSHGKISSPLKKIYQSSVSKSCCLSYFIFSSFLSNYQTKFDTTVKTLIKRSALSCARVARQTKVSALREQMKTFRNPFSSCQTFCRFTTTISRIFLSNFCSNFQNYFRCFLFGQKKCWIFPVEAILIFRKKSA